MGQDLAKTFDRLAKATNGCKRDLRNLLSLKTLKSLNDRDLSFITLKLMGNTNVSVAKTLGIRSEAVSAIAASDKVQRAISEAAWNMQAGIITASDVVDAAEAEVLTAFYELAMNEEIPLDWRFKFGKEILDYNLDRIKALPLPALVDSSFAERVDLLQSRGGLKQRMQGHLGTPEGKQTVVEIVEVINERAKRAKTEPEAKAEGPPNS